MAVQWWAESPLKAVESARINPTQLMIDARAAALGQQLTSQQIQAAQLANQRFGALTPLEVQRAGLANRSTELSNASTEMGLPNQALRARIQADQLRMLGSQLEGGNDIAPAGGTPWWEKKPTSRFENTGKSGPAVPAANDLGSPDYITGGQLRSPVGAAGGGLSESQVPADTDPVGLERWRQGIQSLGGAQLPKGAKRAEILAAANQLANARRQAKLLGSAADEGKLFEAMAGLTTLPNDLAAELNKGGITQQGAILGQQNVSQGISSWNAAEAGRQNAAKDLGVSPDNLGSAGDPNAIKKGQELIARGASYHALKAQVEDIAQHLPTLLDPRNKGALDQQMASVTRLVNKMAGASGTEGAMEMSLMEAGIPKSLISANGIGEAVKIWYTQNPTLRASALRELPDILFRNTMEPDFKAVGGDPAAWKRKLDGKDEKAAGGAPSKARRKASAADF